MSVSLFDLKGRTALMSGAGQGIGLLGSRRRTDCAEWTIGSETRGRRDSTGGGRHRIELRRFRRIRSASRLGGIVKIEAKVGTIGILVTNAGIRHRKLPGNFSVEGGES